MLCMFSAESAAEIEVNFRNRCDRSFFNKNYHNTSKLRFPCALNGYCIWHGFTRGGESLSTDETKELDESPFAAQNAKKYVFSTIKLGLNFRIVNFFKSSDFLSGFSNITDSISNPKEHSIFTY